MSADNIIRSEKPFLDIPDISVGKYIWNLLQEQNPNRICIIEENSDSKLILNELISKSNAISKALIDIGVNKSDIVVTFAENSIEYTIMLFASIFLGNTIYPISPIANIYELENLFKILDSFILITSQSKVELIDRILNNQNDIKVKNVVILDGIRHNYINFDRLLENGQNRSLNKIPYFEINPTKDIFAMLQSSGTSGVPKSVMLSHRSFIATVLHFINSKIVENPVFAHMTPFGCISGISFLFSYLSLGIPIVIYKQMSDESILRSIQKYRVSFMYFTPPFGHKLIDENLVNKYDLSSLKYLFTGGSPFPANVGKALVQKYGVLLTEGYGMTEYFPIVDFPSAENCQYIPGNVGKVSQNCEIKIRDIENGQSLGPNIAGEICVRGPKMFVGYLNNKLATDETIDSEGWLRSGDIGYYDENYCFHITDRLKELIKYQTKAVSPTELEQFLLTHKCVAEVAVVGVKHREDNQWPRAYIKVKTNMSVTEEELKKYVSDNLNYSKQLRAGVVFVDNIPRTTIGKVSRRYFKTLVANEVIE